AYLKASRFIFLNKTGFNGLYRVNKSGYFNVPFGKYKNPDYINENTLRAVHNYLNKNKIEIQNIDFEKSLEDTAHGDFVYLDPPYDTISKTSSFTSYDKNKFGKEEQLRLRNVFWDLYKKGCHVLLSNSNTEFINEIYSAVPGVSIEYVDAKRSINS